jgi:uncharacterized membrane-anchored protein
VPIAVLAGKTGLFAPHAEYILMSFAEHPLRRWTVDEMRLRRFAPVSKDSEIFQSVRLLHPDLREKEDRWLVGVRPDFDDWSLGPRHGSGQAAGGIYFLWERHTEASTLTLIMPKGEDGGIGAPYIRWMERWPGEVVRATRIFVLPDAGAIDEELDKQGLARQDMVCSDVSSGVRIWSDFGIATDGYGRMFITEGTIDDAERGRIIQRVQELGNYRNMALLGFPMVQQYGPQVDVLETRLSDHARRVALADEDDDQLLSELTGISADLELIRSATGFRLSATAAYAEVAADRLAALDVRPVPNYQSLTDFNERRLIPATRTCSVFRQRLDHIALRISGVMHSLDVKLDSRIKAQNLGLMQSMERSTQLQFRLQTLVEGLSVIAAAYYLVGLIGFLIKGGVGLSSGYTADILIGAITLPVILIIYALVRVLRHRVLKDEPGQNP